MVVSKANVIKHMLSMPILNGRVGKWILALSEFDLKYESAKVVKGQVMANFVTQHHKPSTRVMIVRADGGYSSASDFALLAANNVAEGDDFQQDEEHIGAEAAEHYESLMVQRVLSAQMERAEQNQRHTLFQTKCVIKECSCRVIIDGGSCNNLASAEMVEKLSLSTKPHLQPYYIQWLNSSSKVKVT